ncbi:major facilitator superfamily domain-containing protein [Limtongia smithiae]|uniref:major facilitator superfamily domain-containing protein n=1 Tax=Limtongia smithiae TaxID=1125753 RepID=UPI0034CF2969
MEKEIVSQGVVEVTHSTNLSITEVKETFKPAKWRRVIGIFWDTFLLEPVERKFVKRIDFFIFSYSLLSYVIKYLDQSNVSNAYVSGMKEDLALNGQQRNLFTTFFNIGYLIGSIPSQILINRTRPSIFIPSCELVWGILVMCLAAAQNAKTIYGIRFIIGLAESTVFPGFMLVLGSWYYPNELGKRMALFEVSSSAAQMFAGYIQAGVYATMNGRYGVAGWRWAFIIDGIISLPIACIGFYCLPDFPTTTRARWLSPENRAYAVQRMAKVGRKPPRPLTPKRLLKFFCSWRPWVFQGPYNIGGFGASSSYFNLWLTAVGRFTVEQVNIIPTGGNAIAIVVAYFFSIVSDYNQRRAPFIFVAILIPFICNIIIAVWNIPFGLMMAANLINYANFSSQPLVVAWAAESFQDDAETRGLVVGLGNTISYTMSAWLPLFLFPTTEAPHYRLGYKISSMFYGIQLLTVPGFWYYLRWEQRKSNMVLNEFGLAVNRDDLYALESSGEVLDEGEIDEKRKAVTSAVEV